MWKLKFFKNKKAVFNSQYFLTLISLFLFLSISFFFAIKIQFQKIQNLNEKLINNQFALNSIKKHLTEKNYLKNIPKSVVEILYEKESLNSTPENFFNTPLIKSQNKIKQNGFIINAQKGYILTVKHSISLQSTYNIKFFNQEEKKASVVFISEKNDFAILQINNPSKLFACNLTEKINFGEEIFSFNYSDSSQNPHFLNGFISKININLQQNNEEFKNLAQINIKIPLGSSGAPVVNSKGEVLGMNLALSNIEKVSFVLPIENIQKDLKDFL